MLIPATGGRSACAGVLRGAGINRTSWARAGLGVQAPIARMGASLGAARGVGHPIRNAKMTLFLGESVYFTSTFYFEWVDALVDFPYERVVSSVG